MPSEPRISKEQIGQQLTPRASQDLQSQRYLNYAHLRLVKQFFEDITLTRASSSALPTKVYINGLLFAYTDTQGRLYWQDDGKQAHIAIPPPDDPSRSGDTPVLSAEDQVIISLKFVFDLYVLIQQFMLLLPQRHLDWTREQALNFLQSGRHPHYMIIPNLNEHWFNLKDWTASNRENKIDVLLFNTVLLKDTKSLLGISLPTTTAGKLRVVMERGSRCYSTEPPLEPRSKTQQSLNLRKTGGEWLERFLRELDSDVDHPQQNTRDENHPDSFQNDGNNLESYEPGDAKQFN